MAKRPTKQEPELHSWAIYLLNGTPARLIGVVYNQPDAISAIKAAIAEYDLPPRQQGHLLARRRD